jgi:hypothetical protein
LVHTPYQIIQPPYFGPEIAVAQSSTAKALFAYGNCDIFDKKAAQKLLRFFLYGFPGVHKMIHSWAIVPKENNVIETHWIFFRDMRNHLEYYPNDAFSATFVCKTEVQALHNTLKGGLDANSQQFTAISPYFKLKFENK